MVTAGLYTDGRVFRFVLGYHLNREPIDAFAPPILLATRSIEAAIYHRFVYIGYWLATRWNVRVGGWPGNFEEILLWRILIVDKAQRAVGELIRKNVKACVFGNYVSVWRVGADAVLHKVDLLFVHRIHCAYPVTHVDGSFGRSSVRQSLFSSNGNDQPLAGCLHIADRVVDGVGIHKFRVAIVLTMNQVHVWVVLARFQVMQVVKGRFDLLILETVIFFVARGIFKKVCFRGTVIIKRTPTIHVCQHRLLGQHLRSGIFRLVAGSIKRGMKISLIVCIVGFKKVAHSQTAGTANATMPGIAMKAKSRVRK